MRYQPDYFSATIVLVGKLNPSIFSPAWLRKIGVLSEIEEENVNNLFTHPEVAQFSVDRFNLQVLINRYSITTSQEPFIRIVDDTLAVFEASLPHTPLGMLGINYDIQFKLERPEHRIALGRALAPIEPWGAFGKKMEPSPNQQVGGMLNLVMVENRPDTENVTACRRVQIEPPQIPGDLTSVKIQINNHFQLKRMKDEDGTAPILEMLKTNFDDSIAQSKQIVSDLMDFAGSLSC